MLAESMISIFFSIVNVKVEFMHLVLVASDRAVYDERDERVTSSRSGCLTNVIIIECGKTVTTNAKQLLRRWAGSEFRNHLH